MQTLHTACPISLLPLPCSLVFVAVAAAQPRLAVEWKAGRLSVNAERAPLAQILREVARRTGIEVQGVDGLQDPVSVRFSALPLSEGLEKLLAQMNYAILERSSPRGGTRPALVVVSGRRAPPAAPPSAEGTGQEGEAPSEGVVSASQGTAPEEEAEGEVAVSEFEETAPEGEPASGQNPEEQVAALDELPDMPADETSLRIAAESGQPEVRAAALDLLGHVGTPSAQMKVIASSRSEDPEERIPALKILTTVDSREALPALTQALAADDQTVKGAALELLVGLGGPEALGLLDRAFGDSDPATRLVMIQLLAQRGDAESLALLRKGVSDENEVIRTVAQELLEQYEKRE